MGELAAWLAALPDAQLARLAEHVLGAPGPSRALTERALAQRLLDGEWIAHVLDRLGPRAHAAISALERAGEPVLRADLLSLSARADEDPVERLEDHGLVTAVRTGRGMPTHVALTPGVAEIVRARTNRAQPQSAGVGAALGGTRKRFELALVVGAIAQSPPRLTREGRLHATDVGALVELLSPLGWTAPALERRLAYLTELGALSPADGRLRVVPAIAGRVRELYLRLSLAELAAPALPETAMAVVARLCVPGAALPLREAFETAQESILRERATGSDGQRRGARRELAETLSALAGLEAVVLLDDLGHPASGGSELLLARVAAGTPFALALDPEVAALLRGEEPEARGAYQAGHVQSSFEVVADPGCDPDVVARVGFGARLERADLAAVLRLEKRTVAAARSLGVGFDAFAADLAALAGRPLPANVATVVRDWHDAAPEGSAPGPAMPPPTVEALADAAREALAGVA